jgi:hypothetical protein
MKLLAAVFSLALLGCEARSGLPFGSGAQDCAPCHGAQHAQWSTSRHGQSATSPVFQAMLPRVEAAWGRTARDRCLGCHSPGHGGDESIGCVSCHGAVGNRGEANGALEVDLDAPLAGPSPPAHRAAHRTAPRGLLSSASLCGTCHEVHGPNLLEEPTLTEYRSSSFAADDSCLSCHKGPPGALHRFPGVDPPWGAPPEEAARSAEEARQLWAQAVRMEILEDGPTLVLRLSSGRVGHAVPTGAAFLRDVWVDLAWEDGEGQRFTSPRVAELGPRMIGAAGEVSLLTEATRIEPRSLAPGETRDLPLERPAGTAPLRLTATLRARAVRDGALTVLGLDALAAQVPTLDVLTLQHEFHR